MLTRVAVRDTPNGSPKIGPQAFATKPEKASAPRKRQHGDFTGGFMGSMFIVTANTGEYSDKCSYNVFVCASRKSADICLRAIDNWFQLRGVTKQQQRPRKLGRHDGPPVYMPTDIWGRRDAEEAFMKQFGVRISIDYTGVEFDVEEVKVFNDELGS